ncbi:MAG: murein biosynthesis integral membrane protein MurJ [Actinobacteria bacterium]|nr:murein biosynthesis integral membrane protein MurJ [Actinomycetota bacterium]
MTSEEDPGLSRSTAIATAGTAASRITGFIRLAAMVWALGVAETRLTDTYALANTTPNIVYELALSGVLSGVLLRVFIEVREREGEQQAWLFITRLMKTAALLLGGIAILGMLASPLVIRAYTFRATFEDAAAQQRIGSILLIMFMPQIIFYSMNSIATAVLRAQRRFGVFMFAPVLNNLAVATMFLVFAVTIDRSQRSLSEIPTRGLLILGIGTTIGVVLLGVVPWLHSRRTGRVWVRHAGFLDPHFRRLAKLSVFTVGYAAINQAGLWVSIVLANRIQGGVAARDVAFMFFQLPHGLLAVSISIVLGTSLTERAVAQDLKEFGNRFIFGLRGIAFVILPAIAGYMALAPEIVRLLLEHGVVTGRSTDLIASVLRGYAVGLFFFSAWYLMLGGFQGLGDMKTPMLINLASFAVQTMLAVFLFSYFDDPVMKVTGVALAHAGSYLIASILGFRVIMRRSGSPPTRDFTSTLWKVGIGSAATAATAWGLARVAESAFGTETLMFQILQILLAVGGGLLIYFGIAKLLHLEELSWISRIVRGRSQPPKPG